MTPVVELKHLTKKYGDYVAVENVSISVDEGTVLALLGTNGAGKTSIVDMATGLMRPTSGSVELFGVDPHRDRRKVAGRIGIMMQEAGFFDGLTVRDTISSWRRFTPHARSLGDAVAMVALERQLNTAVGRLSGGERRRLDLALALLGKPDLLFLDEPTTGLDPAARRHTWALLAELVRGGLTVVLTTHYMEEAENLADTVAIISSGRLVRTGTLSELAGCAESVVSFDVDGAGSRLALPPDATVDGNRVELTTSDPQRTLLKLLRSADRAGVELTSIRVGGGALENTFMNIVEEVAR